MGDQRIVKKTHGNQEPVPVNEEAEGYVLGGIRYIPLGIVDTDFSQTPGSMTTFDFMAISDDLDGYAYLSSGEVYNGTANTIKLYLKSQYVSFGTPYVTLPANQYYTWDNVPITGIQCSTNSNLVTLRVIKFAAKDEFPYVPRFPVNTKISSHL